MNLIARFVLLSAVLVPTGAQLAAATAADLIGSWVVDTDATWEAFAADPKVGEQIKSMPADQQAMMKQSMGMQFAKMRFDITADKALLTKPDGKVEENSYKVSKIDGDVITIEDTGAKKPGQDSVSGEVTVKDGHLEMRSAKGGPSAALILKPAAK